VEAIQLTLFLFLSHKSLVDGTVLLLESAKGYLIMVNVVNLVRDRPLVSTLVRMLGSVQK